MTSFNTEELTRAVSSHSKFLEYLANLNKEGIKPSKYWELESESLEYMFDASPKVLERLRDHTHWLTGIRSYDYKDHHSHQTQKFKIKYQNLLKESNKLELFGEVGVLGDFGHEIDGKLINLDTLKFMESSIALERLGILSHLERLDRPRICEIGAGWGGFLSHLLRYLPGSQLIVVDLPATLLFSATYLPTAFADRTVGFYGDAQFTGDEDFVFMLPKDFIENFDGRVDLAVNMVSFQEMTDQQVKDYSKKLRKLEISYLYSHNRKKSNHNSEILDVQESIGSWKFTKEVKILPVDYTFLEVPRELRPSKKHQKILSAIIESNDRVSRIFNFVFSDKFKIMLLGQSNVIEKRNYKHIAFSDYVKFD